MYFFLILSTQLVFCQNVSLLYGGIPSGRQNCIFFNTLYTSVLWKVVCFCFSSWWFVISFSLPPSEMVVMPNEENLHFSSSFALILNALQNCSLCCHRPTDTFDFSADKIWWLFFNICSDLGVWGGLMGSSVVINIQLIPDWWSHFSCWCFAIVNHHLFCVYHLSRVDGFLFFMYGTLIFICNRLGAIEQFFFPCHLPNIWREASYKTYTKVLCWSKLTFCRCIQTLCYVLSFHSLTLWSEVHLESPARVSRVSCVSFGFQNLPWWVSSALTRVLPSLGDGGEVANVISLFVAHTGRWMFELITVPRLSVVFTVCCKTVRLRWLLVSSPQGIWWFALFVATLCTNEWIFSPAHMVVTGSYAWGLDETIDVVN